MLLAVFDKRLRFSKVRPKYKYFMFISFTTIELTLELRWWTTILLIFFQLDNPRGYTSGDLCKIEILGRSQIIVRRHYHVGRFGNSSE